MTQRTPGPCGDGAPSAPLRAGIICSPPSILVSVSACLAETPPIYSSFHAVLYLTPPEGRIPFRCQPARVGLARRFSGNVFGLVHVSRRRCWSEWPNSGPKLRFAALAPNILVRGRTANQPTRQHSDPQTPVPQHPSPASEAPM